MISIDQLQELFPELDKVAASLVDKKIKQYPKEVRGYGLYQSTVNKLVPIYNKLRGKKTDPRDAPLTKNEKHAVFMNNDGALVRAMFAGPGTNLKERWMLLLQKNNFDIEKALDPANFVSQTDREALAHDIRYALAETKEQVREADERFTKYLDGIGGADNINVLPSMAGVGGKVQLEKIGAIPEGSFADLTPGKVDKMPKGLVNQYRVVERELRKDGLGFLDTIVNSVEQPWKESINLIEGGNMIQPNQYKCDCGSILRKAGKAMHEKTNKHIKFTLNK